MWTLLLIAAVTCPRMELVSSSVGLSGVTGDNVELLTPSTLGGWLAKRRAVCTTALTVWVEKGLPLPQLPRALAVDVRRFEKEAPFIIRKDRYAQLPQDIRALYPGDSVNFIATTIDQPTMRQWSGPAFRLIPNPQPDITPPYVTVRSSKILYVGAGFSVTWSPEQAWLPVGGWPLPIRFIDDGRAPLPDQPPRAPLEPLGPDGKPCIALALVATDRGLTAIDGQRAKPLANLEAATKWLADLRAKGCTLPLTWWSAEGAALPKPAAAWGKVTFSTFPALAPTLWGERELRTVPEDVLVRSAPQPGDMVVRTRVRVPYLSVCADPSGPDWKPPPPFIAPLEVQELTVKAPFAVLDSKGLKWGGLERTSGRCTPEWKEEDVVLRIPPTALPVRVAK